MRAPEERLREGGNDDRTAFFGVVIVLSNKARELKTEIQCQLLASIRIIFVTVSHLSPVL